MSVASSSRSFMWLFWLLAFTGLIIDLGSKYAVFSALNNRDGSEGRWKIIAGVFDLTAQYTLEKDRGTEWRSPLRTISGRHLPHVNEGALFGLGQGNNTLFIVVSIIAAVGIIFWSTRPNARSELALSVALGLILAGTLGNLFDRIVFDGVRDFLHWYYLIDWPVFNLADSCLVCGATLLLVQAVFFQGRPEKEKEVAKSIETNAETEVVDVR